MFHLSASPFFHILFSFSNFILLLSLLCLFVLLFFFFFFFLCSSPALSFSSCTSPTCPPPPPEQQKTLKHRFVLTEQKDRAGFRSLPGKCCVVLATTKFWKSSFTRFPLSKMGRFLMTPTLAMATHSPNTAQNVHTSMTPTWLPKFFPTPILIEKSDVDSGLALTWIVD